MPGKGPSYADVSSGLAQQYGVLVAAFASLDPDGPTDCDGWTVADLETHVAITARGLSLVAERTVDAPPTGGLAEWAAALPAIATQADAGAKAERLSLEPHAAAAVRALAEHSEQTVVEQVTGRHTLADAALFRLVEAVVHGLDIAVTPDPLALRILVKELARLLAELHPGRTVEVRIPPYAAVQCLEGPRHTRGTPPNVVEADPIAFVRLCAGRERWADLVGDGRIRASGERSDLSPLVPLLG